MNIGVTSPVSVAYIEEDHAVKIYFLDGSFLFYDIEMDDFFMYEMFELTGDDWLGLTEEEKESLLFDFIEHWADLNEIDIQYGGINVWDLRVMLNEYYQNGGDTGYFIFDEVASICIEEGFFTWAE